MKQCLNCGNPLKGPYCEQCGQKSSTHRLSMKHFVEHDLVHGIWHVDRGILYTVWQLLKRPGPFLNEYLQGRRAGVFNVVTLLLICAGLVLIVSDFQGQMTEVETELGKSEETRIVAQVFHFLDHNAKWLILGLIPIFSLASFIVYRKRKYNYTEHLVINSYLFGMFLFLMLLLGLLFKLPFLAWADDASIDFFLGFVYLVYAYWHMWRSDYSLAGQMWRFAAALLLYILLTLILSAVALAIALKFSGK